METLFDPVSHREVLRRVESIQSDSRRHWGKMTVAQMLEHAARALEIAAGRKESKQAFLGKMIGWIFWKGFVGRNASREMDRPYQILLFRASRTSVPRRKD